MPKKYLILNENLLGFGFKRGVLDNDVVRVRSLHPKLTCITQYLMVNFSLISDYQKKYIKPQNCICIH